MRSPRQAIATVEVAICLPVLVAIVFGAIQATDTVHLQHVATLAAYEGTLVAVKDGATRSDVLGRAGGLLTALGVHGGTVQMAPDVPRLDLLAPGTDVTVTVTLPVSRNLTGPEFFMPVREVTARGVTSR